MLRAGRTMSSHKGTRNIAVSSAVAPLPAGVAFWLGEVRHRELPSLSLAFSGLDLFFDVAFIVMARALTGALVVVVIVWCFSSVSDSCTLMRVIMLAGARSH